MPKGLTVFFSVSILGRTVTERGCAHQMRQPVKAGWFNVAVRSQIKLLPIVWLFSCLPIWADSELAPANPVRADSVGIPGIAGAYAGQQASENEQRLQEWHKLMRDLKAATDLSDQQKLKSINDFFNRLEWVSDAQHWGAEDYWATPVETLNSNGGDCEDFAIGKFFSLKAAGIDAKRLRIHYVKALDYNQAHMVLAYYPSPNAEPLILDNIDKVIKPASRRQDLLPIYSFDVDGLWLAKSRNTQRRVGNASSLKAWEEIKRRMALEVAMPL